MRLSSKTIVFVVTLFITIIVWIATNSTRLAHSNYWCSNKFIQQLLPKDSGCFYSAFFEETPSRQKLLFEYVKLENTNNRKGLPKHINWYKSVFYQRFADPFDISLEKIERQHNIFTKTDPGKLEPQIAYVEYLYNKNGGAVKAQQAIDHYCKTYVRGKRPEITKSLVNMLKNVGLDLSIELCN